MVSYGQAACDHPLGVDSRPARALQTASLVVDASGAYHHTAADLVCPSLDHGSDVGRSAGTSGDGNATPVERARHYPCHTGAGEPLLDHYPDRASAARKGGDMCAQHRMV